VVQGFSGVRVLLLAFYQGLIPSNTNPRKPSSLPQQALTSPDDKMNR